MKKGLNCGDSCVSIQARSSEAVYFSRYFFGGVPCYKVIDATIALFREEGIYI